MAQACRHLVLKHLLPDRAFANAPMAEALSPPWATRQPCSAGRDKRESKLHTAAPAFSLEVQRILV